MKRRRPWYVVRGLLAGALLGAMFAPACDELCMAKYMFAGAAIGMLGGGVWEACHR
jgi:hypothetical protein